MDYLQHSTIDGERWDQIAIANFGSITVNIDGVQQSAIALLIKANPDVPIYDVFPPGIVLNIPILQTSDVVTDAERLPPWKQ